MATNSAAHTERPVLGVRTAAMLQLLFAVFFAAGSIGLLRCFGFMSAPCHCYEDPLDDGTYTMCRMLQDARSLLSFLVGGLLCSILEVSGDSCQEQAVGSQAASGGREERSGYVCACLLW